MGCSFTFMALFFFFLADCALALYSGAIVWGCYHLARIVAPDLNLPALHYLFFFAVMLVYYHLQKLPPSAVKKPE